MFSDAQREGDSAADVGPGRGDVGAERDFHFSATRGGGQDQETQEGKSRRDMKELCAQMHVQNTCL